MSAMASSTGDSYYEYYEDDSGIELNDSHNESIIDWMENQEQSNGLRAQVLTDHAHEQKQITPAWRAARTLWQLLLLILWTLFCPIRWTLAFIDTRLSSSNGQVYIVNLHDKGFLPNRGPRHQVVGVYSSASAAKTAVAEMLCLSEYNGRQFLGVSTPMWNETEMGSMVVCTDGGSSGKVDGGFRFIIERMAIRWR